MDNQTLPETSPTSFEPKNLTEIFEQEPTTWTDTQIDEIISGMRRWRASFEQAETTAKSTNSLPRTRSVAAAAKATPTPKTTSTRSKPDLSKFLVDLDLPKDNENPS